MKKMIIGITLAFVSLGAAADNDFQSLDSKLDQAYQQIMARLTDRPDTKSLLVDAQDSWLKFRDAECALQASTVKGGSAYPMVMEICLTGVTARRLQDLEYYLSCEEGDLSCPIPRQD